ncbi:hypothetical protein PSMA106859_24250 [Pseudoalteromonas maricaloris]|uniref:Pre-toxin TG domain-containing protein n=1 Tax=Pseudoalteromonas maricaloris TaxID=184924 RepID=A0ABZ0MHH1_9GAMM|nr:MULTISPECIES: hypothetical protein [Pseudoalteromonas]WOX30572.1 hypothetical protein R5H13_22065 [Pseudoalteromonas maricaloris]
MIPIIDQVMDLRDITGIGLVPVVGSAVKGVGKVILKNTGESLSAALAVLRKLGKGDPVKYLRDTNRQDLGKQSATEVKNIVKGLRDSLDDMSTSWHYDLLLPDAAIESMQATVKRLDDVTPKIASIRNKLPKKSDSELIKHWMNIKANHQFEALPTSPPKPKPMNWNRQKGMNCPAVKTSC